MSNVLHQCYNYVYAALCLSNRQRKLQASQISTCTICRHGKNSHLRLHFPGAEVLHKRKDKQLSKADVLEIIVARHEIIF